MFPIAVDVIIYNGFDAGCADGHFGVVQNNYVLVIYFSPLMMTDINNVINRPQLMEVFGFIQVPGCFLSVVCSVLIILIPQANMKTGCMKYLKLAINILIILASIALPLLSGMNLVSAGLPDAFLFLKVR